MEIDNPDIPPVYLPKLQQVRSTYILSGDIGFASEYNSVLDAFIILKNYDHLANSTTKLIDLCKRDCRYGIAVMDVFLYVQDFMEAAKEIVEFLWEQKIGNCVILGTVGDEILAAQSQGFQADMVIQPSDPILIGQCNSDEWVEKEHIYPTLRMNNSIVEISYIEKEPYISRKNDDFEGIEYEILTILSASMNFGLHCNALNWSSGTTIEEEIFEEFDKNGNIDLVIGGVTWMPGKDVDFVLPYDSAQIVWMVPAHSNISFLGLISPFNVEIWILLVVSILFGSLIKFLFFRKVSFLEITALIIGAAWHDQPVRLSYRMKFISWVVFGYILTQAYLASLAGQLMAHSDTQVDTLEELVNSGLSFGGLDVHSKYFETSKNDDEAANPSIQKIHDEFISFHHDEYQRKLVDLMTGSNSSLALLVTLNMSYMYTDSGHQKVHKLKRALVTMPLCFPSRKGLQYRAQIDMKLERLIQGGIIAFIARNSTNIDYIRRRTAEESENQTNLELDDIIPIFLLLIMGYIAGFLCLLGEFIGHWWCNRKKMKIVESRRKVEKKFRRLRFDEKKLKSSVYNNSLKKRVLKPNVTIGYYDDAGVAWKIV
uniref:Ionotropic glutamate receptor C-terminal domain-containing protein n=1 Tax=Bracon brevicornis TaxID=1563983 RepID=A0A6V7IBB2_9HYME